MVNGKNQNLLYITNYWLELMLIHHRIMLVIFLVFLIERLEYSLFCLKFRQNRKTTWTLGQKRVTGKIKICSRSIILAFN